MEIASYPVPVFIGLRRKARRPRPRDWCNHSQTEHVTEICSASNCTLHPFVRSGCFASTISETSGLQSFEIGFNRICDLKQVCDGVAENVAPESGVQRMIDNRRHKFEEAGEIRYLHYKQVFERVVRTKGREIRRNFFLARVVGNGSFVNGLPWNSVNCLPNPTPCPQASIV